MLKIKYRIFITGSDLKVRTHDSKRSSLRYKTAEDFWKWSSNAFMDSAFCSLAKLIKADDLSAEITLVDVNTGFVIFSTGKITLPTLYKDQYELQNIK